MPGGKFNPKKWKRFNLLLDKKTYENLDTMTHRYKTGNRSEIVRKAINNLFKTDKGGFV